MRLCLVAAMFFLPSTAWAQDAAESTETEATEDVSSEPNEEAGTSSAAEPSPDSAGASAPASEAPVVGVAEDGDKGMSTRDIVSYSTMGAGGVMAITGLVIALTRDGGSQKIDEGSGQLTITTPESRAGGYSLILGGALIAGFGAYLKWIDPSLDNWLDSPFGDDSSVGIVPTANGAAFSLTGSF